jgi:hypothetical protein
MRRRLTKAVEGGPSLSRTHTNKSGKKEKKTVMPMRKETDCALGMKDAGNLKVINLFMNVAFHKSTAVIILDVPIPIEFGVLDCLAETLSTKYIVKIHRYWLRTKKYKLLDNCISCSF